MRAILGLGESLGLEVVAEGVETAEQAALLEKLGCRHAQGFLYGKPMPANELVAWVNSRYEFRPPARQRLRSGSFRSRKKTGGSDGARTRDLRRDRPAL